MHNILDRFDDTNAMLEVCSGYVQSESPNIKALSNVLFNLTETYKELYRELRDRKESI